MERNRKILIGILIVYLIILCFLLVLIFPSAMITIRKYIHYQMSPDMLVGAFICLIFFITMLIGMIFNMYGKMGELKSNSKKEDTKINISLGDERSYLEREINELNKKIVSTDKRWNEDII